MAIILTGHHRSGTSILALVCNSHPQITLTNEFGNFLELGQSPLAYARFILRRWWQRRNVPYRLAPNYPDRIRGTYMLQNLRFILSYLAAVSRVYDAQVVDFATAATALRSILPQMLVGDKHPDYVFHLDRLADAAAAHCIFIYRDPRDLASSVVQVTRTKWRDWFPPEMQEARHVAERWVKFIEIWRQHADSIHAVRYEELVQTPQDTLGALGAWLGVDPAGFRHELIRPGNVGKYRSGLTEQEIRDVLTVAGPTMRELNYLF